MKQSKTKRILKKIIPQKVLYIIWGFKIQISILNTYILRKPILFKNLSSIDPKYKIIQIGWKDTEKLKRAYSNINSGAFKRKIPQRLKNSEWVGLAVVDTTNNDIAYLAWVITQSIAYLEEFGITLKDNQFLLKDGLCFPEYRHQGLHTRMEQERINFCVQRGATEIFIQIADSNEKGKLSVINNGYELYQKNKVLFFPILNIFREFNAVLRNPFKKIVK